METLADALPKEMERVRKVLGTYHEIGPVGIFGAAMIEADLRAADNAVMSGDVIFTERRATFLSLPGLARPAAVVAAALVAAGDYVAGDYPATLERAVRSGISAAHAR